MMMNSIERDTVTTTKRNSTTSMTLQNYDDDDDSCCTVKASPQTESNSVARKRRMTEQLLSKTPKTPRRGCENANDPDLTHNILEIREDDISSNRKNMSSENVFQENIAIDSDGNRRDCKLLKKPPMHPDAPSKQLIDVNRRDDTKRLRKTVQWLEENARRLRQDLADVRMELHEERKAFRIAKREFEVAIKEAKLQEAVKHQRIIAELKTRLLSQSPSRVSNEFSANAKAELLKEMNHKRELSVAKKRLSEADETIRKLKSNSLDPGDPRKKRIKCLDDTELRRMECEIRNLREANKRLDEKLLTVTEAERCRAVELRVQHEKHEAEMSALKKALRSDMIKMMDEIRAKDREIEKLEKLTKRKLKDKENKLMRKLRENERGQQIRLTPRIENKVPSENTMGLCKGEYEDEVERLRELAMEQQEVIEYLRQALKERERKLDQLSNKKRKEEFYKQWLELEPVAEVDDEEEHEEGDSALSSAPSSLSPQPGGWQTNGGITREAYEALILEVDELQTKYLEEQQELVHAKSQVRELEKALLQETRGSQNSRRALSDKLKEAEEREAGLIAEMSELREQNELLEFRVLELEEAGPRESPDTADSGIVSPEPTQLFKDQVNKQRDRVVATVIPYNSYSQSMSPILVQKPPSSLQESGIFDEEETEHEVELTTCGTQTETHAGELLQEVQRLQELRERIQERAAKVPVPMDISDTGEENRLTSYKERIRELEERLEVYEEAEKKRLQEHLIAKQREEDLLDENYRLAEKVYWLENAIQKSQVDVRTMTKNSNTRNSSTSTDDIITEYRSMPCNDSLSFSRCQNIFHEALVNLDETKQSISSKKNFNGFGIATELYKSNNSMNECSQCEAIRQDYDEKIQQLARAECCLRRQMIDLECKERAFAKTLQQVDMTWSQLENDQTAKLAKIERDLTEKNAINQKMIGRIFELEDCIKNHSCCDISRHNDEIDMGHAFDTSKAFTVLHTSDKINQTDEPMEVDNEFKKSVINRFTQTEKFQQTDCDGLENVLRNPSEDVIAEFVEETREEHEEERASGSVSRVHLQSKENPVDAFVSINKSEAKEKQIIYFRWR
ncbi:janus kinase and microtubule-interacting protein 3-like isoform X2 [Chelonus insularis]|uniref:janus kinase and microtubule-interacting protein 3-like isoform X2 n=1 Tax=Chelonus insularis TaxID=460826 RepID=UPI0015889BC8|nr:janus kinase and microtubule-interacting protein 3-like isoform X2 [Chelonus insularis]